MAMHPAVDYLGNLGLTYMAWWRVQPDPAQQPQRFLEACYAAASHCARRMVREPNRDNAWPRRQVQDFRLTR